MKILHILGRIFLVLIITATAVGVSCGGTALFYDIFMGGGTMWNGLAEAMLISAIVGLAAFVWSIWKNNYIIAKLQEPSSGKTGEVLRIIGITIFGGSIVLGINLGISELMYFPGRSPYISESTLILAAIIETIVIFFYAVWFYYFKKNI